MYLIQVYVCGLQFEIKIDEISIKLTVTTNLYSFYEIALRFQINMDSVGDCTWSLMVQFQTNLIKSW